MLRACTTRLVISLLFISSIGIANHALSQTIVVPNPRTLTIDDIGWKIAKSEISTGGPPRLDVNRNPVFHDYEVLVYVAKRVGTRLSAKFILSEFDRENVCAEYPTTTEAGPNWDNSALVSPEDFKIMDYVKENAAWLELGLHGVRHEYWDWINQNGKLVKSEFYNQEDNEPWPFEVLVGHLECFKRILAQYDIHSFPKSYTTPRDAYYYDPETGKDSGALLSLFGVKYASNDMRITAEYFTPPEVISNGGVINNGVLWIQEANTRNSRLPGYKDIATIPKVHPDDGISLSHWVNWWAQDPKDNYDIGDGYIAWFEEIKQNPSSYLVKNIAQYYSQWLYRKHTVFTHEPGILVIDNSAMPDEAYSNDLLGNLLVKFPLSSNDHLSSLTIDNEAHLVGYYEEAGFGHVLLSKLQKEIYRLEIEIGESEMPVYLLNDGTYNVFNVDVFSDSAAIDLELYGTQVIKIKLPFTPTNVASLYGGLHINNFQWDFNRNMLLINVTGDDIMGQVGTIVIKKESTQIISDPLNKSWLGAVYGGKFLDNGGWTPQNWSDMIVYDLGKPISNGRFEIQVRNFDPRVQNSIQRHHILSMYSDQIGDHNHSSYNSGDPQKSVWNLHTGSNYNGGIKLLSIATNKIETRKNELYFDRNRTYKLEVSWEGNKIDFFVDGALVLSNIHHSNLSLRYLFIGRDYTHSLDFQTGFPNNEYPAQIGPIYSNLAVYENANINDPIIDPGSGFVQRVNAGGLAFSGVDFRYWAADQEYSEGSWGYVGGQTYDSNDLISNTSDDNLYQSERYNMSSYRFTVPFQGTYQVQLHFAEIFYNLPGIRAFDVLVEGSRILTNLDIYSETGHDAALVREFQVAVHDSVLDLDFVNVNDNSKISAIEVTAIEPFHYNESISKLVFTSITEKIEINKVSEILTIQTQSAQGIPVNVIDATTLYLLSSSATGEFSVSNQPFVPVDSVIIPFGENSTNFFYRDSMAGLPVLSVSEQPEQGWEDVEQQLEVGLAPAVPVIISFEPKEGTVGTEVIIFGAHFTRTFQVHFNGKEASDIVLDSDSVLKVIVPSGASTGSITVFTVAGKSSSSNHFQVITPTIISYSLRVNAGGGSFMGSDGQNWNADQEYAEDSWGFVGGQLYDSNDPIANTEDDSLFQYERYGMKAYRFMVPTPGLYLVRLLFAEIFFTAPNRRIFDVNIEGVNFPDLSNVDIYTIAGHDVAVIKDFEVDVIDGVLDVEFHKNMEDPKISAIEVELLGAPTPPPEIFGFDPQEGFFGTEVTISGQNFTKTTQVSFNDIAASSVIVDSDSQLVAVVPSGSSTGKISMETRGGSVTSTADFVITIPPLPDYVQRVNASGNSYTSSDGRTWSADKEYTDRSWGYVGGRTFIRQDEIFNTDDDELFQSERYKMASYRFTVPAPGLYNVQLLFSEIFHNEAGKRIFSVLLEEKSILNNLDVYSLVGHDVSLVQEFEVQVDDGVLDIDFVKIVDSPKISAIEVTSINNGFSKNSLQPTELTPLELPDRFELTQNYPNPFNPETRVRLSLPNEGFLTAVIYDIHGREIRRIYNDSISAGQHQLLWKGVDQVGVAVSSGIYLLQVIYESDFESQQVTRRMVLLK